MTKLALGLRGTQAREHGAHQREATAGRLPPRPERLLEPWRCITSASTRTYLTEMATAATPRSERLREGEGGSDRGAGRGDKRREIKSTAAPAHPSSPWSHHHDPILSEDIATLFAGLCNSVPRPMTTSQVRAKGT
jgi:hypothetical protein